MASLMFVIFWKKNHVLKLQKIVNIVFRSVKKAHTPTYYTIKSHFYAANDI